MEALARAVPWPGLNGVVQSVAKDQEDRYSYRYAEPLILCVCL